MTDIGKDRSQQYLLDTALENMSHGLCMFDADGRIMLFNERYARLMGLPATALKGLSLLDVFKLPQGVGTLVRRPRGFFQRVLSGVREGKSSTRVVETEPDRWLRVTAQPLREGGWVSTLEDITEWREAQAQIVHMARHDALTDLPNRTLFREQLELALCPYPATRKVAVLCLDLDNFKNDQRLPRSSGRR